LKSYWTSASLDERRELMGLSASLVDECSSFFLMSSFSTGDLHDIMMDHAVKITTHSPTNTAETTKIGSAGGLAG
jgi:hypothetical protein